MIDVIGVLSTLALKGAIRALNGRFLTSAGAAPCVARVRARALKAPAMPCSMMKRSYAFVGYRLHCWDGDHVRFVYTTMARRQDD
jgi:hypothetical protein